MRLIPFYLFVFSLAPIPSVLAASENTTVQLPAVEFTGQASFETLQHDTFLPQSDQHLNGDRSTTIDSLKYEIPYTFTDYGFPGGATNANLGGRSSNDTQVTTLGVPLNLPQGSADFSIFPSYLWSSASLSQSTSSAGFAPGAASGRIDFTPWTRSMLLEKKNHGIASRATVSYDQHSQTYSLGTRTNDYSLLAGASSGDQEGVSGEGSGIIFRNTDNQVLVHVIGTSVKAKSPGSLSFPSPRATFKNWRVIPVVEGSFHLSEDIDFQSTAFLDLSNQVYEDPGSLFNPSSDTRSQQAGLENVFQIGLNTVSLSARFVRYLGATYGEIDDFPLYSAFTHEFILSDEASLKATINAVLQRSSGIGPGGKLSFKFASSQSNYPFAEVNTVSKQPSLTDRYAVFGTYHGNPDLKAERVYAALGGYHAERNGIVSTSILKSEFRTDVQVPTSGGLSLTNNGNAYLLSATQEIALPVAYWLDFHSNTLFTYSKLVKTGFSYPDLPFVSTAAGLLAHLHEDASFAADARLIGYSAGPAGAAHEGYVLCDLETGYRIFGTSEVHFGIDNLFGSHAQAVLDYPLEGRTFFASLNAQF